ncbi:hypothetical protein MINS_19590 [Mycolicibacterium insubricum]|nr:hypothetical protein [Mycolicibacterium insubricum]MCB9440041.1 hypothetical protein [Mycolicibacterium sp.]MCV7082914.1 hypothetical protein [Mycolicibacterium insubricum]BBZ66530.1 hypothetical protein MINS_19590 [Mycolicibacterium insubricum]
MSNINGLTRFRRGALTASGMATAAVILTLGTAGSAAAEYVVEKKFTIAPSGTINVEIKCAEGMYLDQTDYSSKNRAVPRGIEVIEGAFGVGVTMFVDPMAPPNGPWDYAGGTATNWDPTKSQDVIIKAHCR